MDRVEVTWIDAISENGSIPIDVARKMRPVERSNIGYLLKKDRKVVVLTNETLEFDNGSHVGERIVLPLCMVTSIKYLDVRECPKQS